MTDEQQQEDLKRRLEDMKAAHDKELASMDEAARNVAPPAAASSPEPPATPDPAPEPEPLSLPSLPETPSPLIGTPGASPAATPEEQAALPPTREERQQQIKERITLREHQKDVERHVRQGIPIPPQPGLRTAERGMDLDDAVPSNVRNPDTPEVRGMGDLASAVQQNQRQLIDTLNLMSRIMVETVSDLEQIQRYFHRLL